MTKINILQTESLNREKRRGSTISKTRRRSEKATSTTRDWVDPGVLSLAAGAVHGNGVCPVGRDNKSYILTFHDWVLLS